MKTNVNELRGASSTILRLPEEANYTLNSYLNFRIKGAIAAMPYHINPGVRSKKRALIGKGSPEEIALIANYYFKKYTMDPGKSTTHLRAFLNACGLGIDCSGFVSWIMNSITEVELHKPIWKCLVFTGARKKLLAEFDLSKIFLQIC